MIRPDGCFACSCNAATIPRSHQAPLWKNVEKCFELGLNLTLVKRVLQMGILVEDTLYTPYYSCGYFPHFFIDVLLLSHEIKMNFFSVLLKIHV